MATQVTRVLLRLPSALHASLRRAAKTSGLSLNEYIVRRLSAPAPSLAASEDALAVMRRAKAVVGPRLLGLIVHGSWARGEAARGSDVDLLVVVARDAAITRELYRIWDREPVRWRGRVVDPHFVRLPDVGDRVTGLWAEAAIDGLVLYEADDRLSAWLARVRREIAAGRLVRRVVHGQPYWTAA
ncbi:MAG TPA: nucleotidyltransferase domain-containing protein [Vicinamibacterales bacterium]|nr:nucleotidyltransferase domain-containing protein [Vicinamibacterales bacterium]